MSPLRRLHAVSLALLLGAAAGTGAHENNASVQGLRDSLVEYAAADFASNGPRPEGFRDVDLRYRENDHGARVYLLCGQARMGAGDRAEWIDFATIRTDPYEQWLGGTAADMCKRAVVVPTQGGDLSAALEAKLGHGGPSGKP